MTAAYRARTYGELDPLTKDLPDVTTATPKQELTLRAQGSSVRREGRWAVPRRLVVEAKHGGVRLDLTKAVVLANEVEVAITAAHASVRIIVPPGTDVVDEGVAATWSSVSYEQHHEPGRSRLRLRLTGSSRHSSVKVRTATIFDLWLQRLKSRWRQFLRPS